MGADRGGAFDIRCHYLGDFLVSEGAERIDPIDFQPGDRVRLKPDDAAQWADPKVQRRATLGRAATVRGIVGTGIAIRSMNDTAASDAPPQTLADVKAGDEVAACWSVYASLHTVSRVTPAHIIIGDWRFRRDDGRRIGSGGGRAQRISLGPASLALARRAAFVESVRSISRMTQESVRALRDACDRAEAALRGDGEWEDVTDAG